MAFGKGLKIALIFMFSASTFSATVPTQTLELSPSLESSSALVNASIITNLTAVTQLNVLPPDPYTIVPWVGARYISVEFSHYVPGIWNTDALSAILEASRFAAIENYKGNGNKPIAKTLKYTFGTVTLSFVPEEGLQWKTWGLALSGLTDVFDKYEYTGFTFIIKDVFLRVGKGYLFNNAAIATPLATPQATPQAA